MRGVNVIITDGLKNELKNLAEQVCIGAANYAREALTDIAYEAFERFYADYTPRPGGITTSYDWKFVIPRGVPKVYHRTYNILKYGIQSYENKHGKIIRGGVELDPNNLKDNYDQASPTEVFESIYEFGWHGPEESKVPPMVPTPEEFIYNSYDNMCNYVIATVVRSEIPSIIKSGNYEYLRSHGISRKVSKIKEVRWNK